MELGRQMHGKEVCQLDSICLVRFYASFTDHSLQPLIDLVTHGRRWQEQLGMHGYDAATSKVASADSVAGRMATGGQIFMCSYFLLRIWHVFYIYESITI